MEQVIEKIKNIFFLPSINIELILLSFLILSKATIESYKTPSNSEEHLTKSGHELYSNLAAIKLGKKLSDNVNISQILEKFRNASMATSTHTAEEKTAYIERAKIFERISSITVRHHTPQSQLVICEAYLTHLIDMYSEDRDRFKQIINENRMSTISLFKEIIMTSAELHGGEALRSGKKNRKGRTIQSRKFIQQGGNVLIDFIVNSLNRGDITITMIPIGEIYGFLRFLSYKTLVGYSNILTLIMMNIDAGTSHDKRNIQTILTHGAKSIINIQVIKHHLDVTMATDFVFYLIDRVSGKISISTDIFNKLQVNESGQIVRTSSSFGDEINKAGLAKLYHTMLVLTLHDGTYVVVEKNPAVDIYTKTQHEVDQIKTKPGFESFNIELGSNSITFDWLMQETEKSTTKQNFFNYKLFGGTCQDFVHLFVETLSRNGLISGQTLNHAEMFYKQLICRLEKLYVDVLGKEVIPFLNTGQTTVFLLCVSKRQFDSLFNRLLIFIRKNNITIRNIFTRVNVLNTTELLCYLPIVISEVMSRTAPLSQGGKASRKMKRRGSKKKQI